MRKNVVNNSAVSSENRSDVCDILQQMGLTPEDKGYDYMVDAICLAIKDPERMTQVVKGLYLEVAGHYGISCSCVERNIRKAVRIIWTKDQPLLKSIVYGTLPSCPKQSFFLASVTEYVIVRRMSNQKSD